jgi:hypothetical protein
MSIMQTERYFNNTLLVVHIKLDYACVGKVCAYTIEICKNQVKTVYVLYALSKP